MPPPPRIATLFPYTTLFRSASRGAGGELTLSDKRASTDHPIHDLLAARWSPYAFEDRPVSDTDLRSLFEAARWAPSSYRSEEHTSELQSRGHIVCRLLLEKT